VEPFVPEFSHGDTDILVVDGFINATSSSANVALSRTRSLTDTLPTQSETGAHIQIETSLGDTFALSEVADGSYTVDGISIDKTGTYALRIMTADGGEYVSHPVMINSTPPIDSLSYGLSGTGEELSILVNTHDGPEDSGYFAWSFSETYQYNSRFGSAYKWVDNTPVLRGLEDRIDQCWKTDISTKISIGSSTSLAENAIRQHELTLIPKGSPKTSVRYSILLKQRAISSEEYSYLKQLKNATETLGTLFDPTPGVVTGNIRDVKQPLSTVLGFFSAGEVIEQRYFIDFFDLPEELQVPADWGFCQLNKTCDNRLPRFTNFDPPCTIQEDIDLSSVLISAILDDFGTPIQFIFTTVECGDCRTYGGTTQPPDFW